MSIQYVKGSGAVNPDGFKGQYTGYLVTAHPFPRQHRAILKSEGDEALYMMKGNVTVTIADESFDLTTGDQLVIKKPGQFSVITKSDIGSFLLKASKSLSSTLS